MRGADGRLAPPQGGHPPPLEGFPADDVAVPLTAMAQEICRRYRAEFPDEQGRYGDAGNAWCVHDNQHLLFWGAGAVNGFVTMADEVGWLTDVLAARGFPLDRLARDLEIAADVVRQDVAGDLGAQWADVMAAGADVVRRRVGAPHERGEVSDLP